MLVISIIVFTSIGNHVRYEEYVLKNNKRGFQVVLFPKINDTTLPCLIVREVVIAGLMKFV